MTEPSDDELRDRLARADPAPAGVPVDPVTGPRARERVERAMRTPVQTPTHPAEEPDAGRFSRRPLLLAAAAAVLIALVGGGFALLGGSGPGGGATDPASTLALELPASDVAASCMVFDVRFLAEVPVALGGTVSAVEEEQVTLDVDRWYRGGDADVVTLSTPAADSSAVLDGVDFREGERYLVSASEEGAVTGCGFSGPATPELGTAFETAFPG